MQDSTTKTAGGGKAAHVRGRSSNGMRRRVRAERARANDLEAEQRTAGGTASFLPGQQENGWRAVSRGEPAGYAEAVGAVYGHGWHLTVAVGHWHRPPPAGPANLVVTLPDNGWNQAIRRVRRSQKKLRGKFAHNSLSLSL